MSFLAPGFLIAAAGAALGVVALHFIVTRRPRAVAFPTARFVPDVPVTARARSVQLSDLLLLAIRVLIILLAGAALARPIFPPERERVVRVIAADVSGSVQNVAETRDSVRALFRPGDAVVLFDTATWPVETPDSVRARAGVASNGSLSAGLIGALRAGSRVREGADSVELLVVSPATLAERDRATAAIRA
ncbi:MAG TPA: BatA domain-containing protein, partial [Gemmatimonadaceae bacterium]|nr:BatA domain-containing protein [Gemmatimonadaceae bacterium]